MTPAKIEIRAIYYSKSQDLHDLPLRKWRKTLFQAFDLGVFNFRSRYRGEGAHAVRDSRISLLFFSSSVFFRVFLFDCWLKLIIIIF